MSHVNCSVRNARTNDLLELERCRLEAELKFWKAQAAYYLGELENIPQALREWGEWHITDMDGEKTHVILDPKHHPETEQ